MAKVEIEMPGTFDECQSCTGAMELAEKKLETLTLKDIEIFRVEVSCQPSDYSRLYRCPDIIILYKKDNQQKTRHIPEDEHIKCPGIEAEMNK